METKTFTLEPCCCITLYFDSSFRSLLSCLNSFEISLSPGSVSEASAAPPYTVPRRILAQCEPAAEQCPRVPGTRDASFLHSSWDLSSLARDWTQALSSESRVLTTGPPGNPQYLLYFLWTEWSVKEAKFFLEKIRYQRIKFSSVLGNPLLFISQMV